MPFRSSMTSSAFFGSSVNRLLPSRPSFLFFHLRFFICLSPCYIVGVHGLYSFWYKLNHKVYIGGVCKGMCRLIDMDISSMRMKQCKGGFDSSVTLREYLEFNRGV